MFDHFIGNIFENFLATHFEGDPTLNLLPRIGTNEYNRIVELIGDTLDVCIPFQKIETTAMDVRNGVLDISKKKETYPFLFTVTFQLKEDVHYEKFCQIYLETVDKYTA